MRHRFQRIGLAAILALGVAACGGDDGAADDPPITGPSTGPVGGRVTGPPQPTVPAPRPTTAATVATSVAPAPSTAPTVTTLPTLLSIADEHVAFTLALPDAHPITASGIDDFVAGGACPTYWWQLGGGILIEAWPASCDVSNEPPGNGSYGHYRTLADAPSAEPAGTFETVLGPAELAEQIYYECTNSCTEWPLDLAVIELSEPVDDEYPTLTVIATDRDATLDDLTALLASFGAG